MDPTNETNVATAADEPTSSNDSMLMYLSDAELRRLAEYDQERAEYATLIATEKPSLQAAQRLLVLAQAMNIPYEQVRLDTKRAIERAEHHRLIQSLAQQAGELQQQVATLESRRASAEALAGHEIPLHQLGVAGFVSMIWNNPSTSPQKREKVAMDFLRVRGWRAAALGWRRPGVTDQFNTITLAAALKEQLAADFDVMGTRIDQVLSDRAWAIITGKSSPDPALEAAPVESYASPNDPVVPQELESIAGNSTPEATSA